MIKRKGKKFVVKSESGKNLSRPLSESAAKERLSEIEYFKHRDKEDLRNGYRRSYK